MKFLDRFYYDMFLTITFREPTSEITAKRKFKRFLKHLNTADEKFYHNFIYLWLFIERNKKKEGVHLHALITGINLSKSFSLEQKCLDHFGQSKVKAMHNGVLRYLARKYTSPSLIDLDYLKINSRLRYRFNHSKI